MGCAHICTTQRGAGSGRVGGKMSMAWAAKSRASAAGARVREEEQSGWQ